MTASAQPDDGRLGIRLVDAPVERRNDPRAEVYIIDHVPPGATLTRRIELQSSVRHSISVDLYAGAATIRDGRWSPSDGRTGNEVTDWISIDPSNVQVPAMGSVRAEVTIRVDGTAAMGERYAVIWAEPPAGTAQGLTFVNRVGVRVYLSVGSGGEPASDFVVDSLTAMRDSEGRPVVAARVENTGGRALDLSGELSLHDGPGGLRAGPFPADLGTTLAPGDTAPVTVVLDPALPAGPWEAELLLRSGRLERLATATIAFPDAPGEVAPPAPAVTTDVEAQRRWLLPFALGLLLLALLLLALATRRRARDHQPA